MSHEERRNNSGRRITRDRRQNGSGMISAYANHNGPERRSNRDRRGVQERRTASS